MENRVLPKPPPYILAAQRPDMDIPDALPLFYFEICCAQDGVESPEGIVGTRGVSIVPHRMWPNVENSFFMMNNLLQLSRKGEVELSRDAWLGTHDPELDQLKATNLQKCQSDTALMIDMITTIKPYMQHCQSPVDDELMKGLWLHATTRKRPLWLHFAGQVYLEIHHVLRSKAEMACEDLTDWALEARKTLRGHVKFNDKHGLAAARTDKEEILVLSTKSKLEEWVLEDEARKVMNKYLSTTRPIGQPNRTMIEHRQWKENEVLRMHPLICGVWKYSFQLKLQRTGIQLVNESQIMIVIHLYNALQQCGYLDRDCIWLDAEYLLNIHRKTNTFGGDRPTTMEDCLKRLSIAQGVSPQTFASNRRNGSRPVVHSKKGPRFLQETTPIAGVFKKRYLEKGDMEYSVENIEEIVAARSQNAFAQDRDEEIAIMAAEMKVHHITSSILKEEHGKDMSDIEWQEWTRMALKDRLRVRKELKHASGLEEDPIGHLMAGQTNEEYIKTAEKMGRHVGCNRSMIPEATATYDMLQQEHVTDIVSFLKVLADALEEEKPDIIFDYFAFYRSTYRLLIELRDQCLPVVAKQLREHSLFVEVLSQDGGVMSVPDVLMRMACNVKKAESCSFTGRESDPV